MNSEVTTIGPECFTDGEVICYKGENYTRQPRTIEHCYDDNGPSELLPLAVILSGGKPAIKQYDQTWMDWDGSSWDDWELEYPLTVLHEPEPLP